MNFTLLFTVVENLSFVIDFKLSLDQKQDFLFFEGVNDSAHLFRQNSTILLNVNNELYKTDIVDRIQFSWRGFKVNGSEMEKIKSGKQEKFRKTRKVFISHSYTKNISKNIIRSIYFSYLYLDRKHIFVVFMTMFRFIVPKLI